MKINYIHSSINASFLDKILFRTWYVAKELSLFSYKCGRFNNTRASSDALTGSEGVLIKAPRLCDEISTLKRIRRDRYLKYLIGIGLSKKKKKLMAKKYLTEESRILNTTLKVVLRNNPQFCILFFNHLLLGDLTTLSLY